MNPREKLVGALECCLDFIGSIHAIDGIWEVTSEEDLADFRKAREQVTEVIRQALAADQAERN